MIISFNAPGFNLILKKQWKCYLFIEQSLIFLFHVVHSSYNYSNIDVNGQYIPKKQYMFLPQVFRTRHATRLIFSRHFRGLVHFHIWNAENQLPCHGSSRMTVNKLWKGYGGAWIVFWVENRERKIFLQCKDEWKTFGGRVADLWRRNTDKSA